MVADTTTGYNLANTDSPFSDLIRDLIRDLLGPAREPRQFPFQRRPTRVAPSERGPPPMFIMRGY